MGEFVFPETIKMMGQWGEGGGGGGGEKKGMETDKKEKTEKTISSKTEKKSLFDKFSHSNISAELSMAQVFGLDIELGNIYSAEKVIKLISNHLYSCISDRELVKALTYKKQILLKHLHCS